MKKFKLPFTIFAIVMLPLFVPSYIEKIAAAYGWLGASTGISAAMAFLTTAIIFICGAMFISFQRYE